MSTTPNTPLPWAYAPSGPVMEGYAQPFAIAQRGEANLIAGCFGDVFGGHETAEANAAFIVDAVNSITPLREQNRELVDALRALLATDECKCGSQSSETPAFYSAVQAARAALAKVEA